MTQYTITSQNGETRNASSMIAAKAIARQLIGANRIFAGSIDYQCAASAPVVIFSFKL